MTAAWLNHIALMHVYQVKIHKLNQELTMQSFVSGVNVREETFGKFWVSDTSHIPKFVITMTTTMFELHQDQ